MAEYRIRPASARDLDTVLDHRRRMFEQMGHTDPDALAAMSISARPLLARGLADGAYRGWLVELESGEVVAGGGIILIEFQPHPLDPHPRRAFVVNMFTEPAQRRRGLARRLMETMLGWAREEGLRSLYLHASEAGRPLYESLGFVATNEMRLPLREEGPPRL